jgi:Eco29kI-like restriction endonuclease
MSEGSYDPYNPLAIPSIAESLARELLNQPCGPLPPAKRFNGAGVYVIYYRGPFPEYAPIARRNQDSCEAPIYIGKAVPKGGRKGVSVATGATTQALNGRLAEHAESIKAARNLDLADFRCKFRVIEELFIELAERALIQEYKPLWNAYLDGFGNHDPGSGRYSGKRPSWDVVHEGRSWASKLQPADKSQETLLAEIRAYLAAWERGQVGEVTIIDDGSGNGG